MPNNNLLLYKAVTPSIVARQRVQDGIDLESRTAQDVAAQTDPDADPEPPEQGSPQTTMIELPTVSTELPNTLKLCIPSPERLSIMQQAVSTTSQQEQPSPGYAMPEAADPLANPTIDNNTENIEPAVTEEEKHVGLFSGQPAREVCRYSPTSPEGEWESEERGVRVTPLAAG